MLYNRCTTHISGIKADGLCNRQVIGVRLQLLTNIAVAGGDFGPVGWQVAAVGGTYLVQGVGQAGHQLGLHKLGLTTLELALLLHCEAGWLHAELVKPGGAEGDGLQCGWFSDRVKQDNSCLACHNCPAGETFMLLIQELCLLTSRFDPLAVQLAGVLGATSAEGVGN